MPKEFDLIVIGAGPGGYVASIRAAQLGLSVACIDKEEASGGTCLRVGCIPSKALLESSHRFWSALHDSGSHGIRFSDVKADLKTILRRKDEVVQTLTRGVAALLKKNKVTRFHGHARFEADRSVHIESQGGTENIRARHVLIATGSKPAPLKGVDLDGATIGTSTEALSYSEVPGRLIVIGAGYIGLELGSVWRRLGAKVTVIEYLDRILPGMDAELASEAKKIFEKQGIEFRLNSRVEGARVSGKGCSVKIKGERAVRGDRVLLAVGRRPNTDGLGLETIGVDLDDQGRIEVNEHFATSAPGVYAIGDVIKGPMLAHKAEEEGVALAERLATGRGHVDYQTIPGVVYTHPEIASVGLTEEALKESKRDYRRGVFPFRANGRAITAGEPDGMVKVLADAATDRILGVHMIGPHAGELINEAAVAMSFGASSEDLARSCHAHPTHGEALREAALAVDRRAIHA